MFSNEILTTADDILLISGFGLAKEVNGRNPAHLGRGMIGPGVSSEVAVEEENGSEEKECQQSERITGVAPNEGHCECEAWRVGLPSCARIRGQLQLECCQQSDR